MITSLKEAACRKISTGKRLLTALILWALLIAVLPLSFFSAVKEQTPFGMVYCPLSRKPQPIEPLETKKRQKPFDALCASTKTKEYLYREIFLKTPWRVFTLDAKSVERLIFDYIAHGKTALDKLPGRVPPAPSENLIKQIASSTVAGNRSGHKFVWKPTSIAFLPAAILTETRITMTARLESGGTQGAALITLRLICAFRVVFN